MHKPTCPESLQTTPHPLQRFSAPRLSPRSRTRAPQRGPLYRFFSIPRVQSPGVRVCTEYSGGRTSPSVCSEHPLFV